MTRPVGALILGAVCAFLVLFLLLPMLSLVLVGFTGQPVDLLGHVQGLDPVGLCRELSDKVDLRYYSEFFVTRRYLRGFLNSLGVAPLVAMGVFGLARGALSLVGRASPGVAARWSRRVGLPFMVAVLLLTTLVAVTWRAWVPVEDQAGHWMRLVAPGRTWDGRLWQALGFCPLVALASSVLGVAMAFSVVRTTMPLRQGIRMMCILPLALPPFLGALAFRNLFGEGGLLTRVLETVGLSSPFEVQSLLAAGIVQTFLFFPFVLLTTAAALDRVDPGLGEATQVLGARPAFAWWTVHLPLLLPGISAGAFLAFIRSFGDFATLSLLAPLGRPMIVVEAYRDLSGSTDWGGASMLSTVMILTMLGVLALQKSLAEGGDFQAATGRVLEGGRRYSAPWLRWGALLLCGSVMGVPVLFVAATLLVSLSGSWGLEILPTAYTLSRYAHLAQRFFQADSPLFNSFALVLPALLGATLLALVVAWTVARGRHWSRHLLDYATVLPFVVPGVAFAVALIGIFNGPPLALHLTATLVVCAYMVTRMPYGVRTTLASFQQVGASLEESSTILGATAGLTTAKVTLPLVLPGLAAGGIMVFISAMQDVAITLMTCPPRWYPASVYVFQRIQEGDVFEASAYGLVLLGLVLVPYALAWRLGGVRTSL